jgi:cellobiose transport system substrate-binding protein
MHASKRPRKRQRAAQALLGAFLLVGLAACGGADDGASQGANEKFTLTVNTFGNFGYEPLYRKFEQSHPNITIKERVSEYNAHHQQLNTHLASRSGAADVEAVDEGFIVGFKAQPQNFANLLDHGAGDLKSRWLPWKWEQSLTADGKQIGLGTDVGGLAMCYRADLFKAAGLPSDREAVSKLWPDWSSFISTGTRFESAGTGVKFFDAGTNVFNAMVAQLPEAYFNRQDQLVIESNAPLKQAWDMTLQAVQAKQSAKLTAFSPQWNAGFQKGTFATVTCPAWMRGYIEQQAPKTTGKWDVATVPGNSGNWGGSFLTVPAQGKHVKEAYELAAFLTSPESQLAVWEEVGNLPSAPELYTDPKVSEFTTPFFSNAPLGELFTTAAKNLQPQYQGPKHGQVRQQVENAIRRVEAGQQQPDAAWQQAIKDAQRIVG